MMKQMLISATLMALLAVPAQAGCYADYKAKRDNPLNLHYGVVELPDTACGSTQAAGGQIATRIGVDGWKLIKVMSIFGPDGLNQRRDSAGSFYLRY